MTEKHDKWVCKSCGHVREMDTGWAEAKEPSPEISMGSILPPPPEVEPARKSEATDAEYVDVGLGFALGDCNECGGHSWQRISLSSLEKEDPKVEKPEGADTTPAEKGFQEVIPPSPEISQSTIMMQDTYSPPAADPERPPREPGEPVEPGVPGALSTLPLGGEETNPNILLPVEAELPVAQIPDSDKPKKEKYVCEKCGEQIELELDQNVVPPCKLCGSNGWLKESF